VFHSVKEMSDFEIKYAVPKVISGLSSPSSPVTLDVSGSFGGCWNA
jgi:hypothetical protein